MEQKYVVFKKSDFDRLMKEVPSRSLETELRAAEVEDCFVIRFQDVLAGPGLHAYAHSAETMIEGALFGSEGADPVPSFVSGLEHVRDAAFEAAQIADEYPNKKVPD